MKTKTPKLLLVATVVVLILAACSPATAIVPTAAPQVIRETVVVTQEVEVQTTQLVVETQVVVATEATVDFWKPEEITAACGVEKCVPLATLPKQFSKPWKLAFVTANKGNPFHGAFSDGIKAAAEFYGVEFIEADAAGGPGNAFLDLADTLFLQTPDAIGVLGQGPDTFEPVAAAAQAKNVLFLPADSGKSEYSSYIYGIPDTIAGKTAGELLATGVQERLDTDWNGRELFFVEFTHGAIPACVNRTAGFRTAFADKMGLDADHLIMADVAGGQTAQDFMAAALTSHPEAVLGLTGCWDQLGIDPFNSAREAGREDDVMLVTMGGDKPPADLLVTKPKGYYGYVEWQPFAEGWGWAETALAILEGIAVKPYEPKHITTQENIEERYVELYGALPTPAP